MGVGEGRGQIWEEGKEGEGGNKEGGGERNLSEHSCMLLRS